MQVEHATNTAPPNPPAARPRLPAAERLLLDIFDSIREPLLLLDTDYRVTQANRAFFRTFHVAPDDTIGEVLFELGDGQWNVASIRALLRDRITSEQPVHDIEIDHVFPGIGRKIMALHARLVAHDSSESGAILLAIADVTERRLTERRLARQHRELERSNVALHEFAFVASHDLQEPLRKILSFGERLGTSAGPMLSGNPAHYLERMLDAATRMRTLINDLLSYSQIATSTEPFANVDLAEIARAVVNDLETAIADAHGRVDVADLPVIEADATQMRRLLQNLIGNALKFRRAGVDPLVEVRATQQANDAWTITVTDNGIGFKEEQREKIFGMFERLHARARYEGSGIGLAICRRIVERHGGTIAATSSTGQGATFSVTLPTTQPEAESWP